VSKLRFFVAQGLLAFLPALVVMLVARHAPDDAADLSIAMGAVGAIFSIAYFGQRAYVAIRGFDVIACRQALSFPAVLSVVAGLCALAVALGLNIALGIVLFAVALKLSEGVIDLWVGVRLRLSTTEQVARAFVGVSLARALLVVLPVLVLGAYGALQSPLVAAYLAGLAVGLYALAHRDTRRLGVGGSYALSSRALWSYGWEMRAFVSATATCAVLSSLPRVILPYAAAGRYAPEAMALSIVPLCGLACQAAWLSGVKRMTEAPRKHAWTFVLEIAAIAVLVALLSPLWRWGAGAIYHLDSAGEQERFAAMMVSGVLVTGAISLSNLFKLTQRPRHESWNYVLGSASILVATFVFRTDARVALTVAAVAMSAFVLVLFRAGDGASATQRRQGLSRARA